MVNKMAKNKKENVVIYSPIGRLSYPYLAAPDTGRKESSNKYGAEIYIPKAVWATAGKEIMAAALKVIVDATGDKKAKLKDFKLPFFDMDTKADAADWQKGTIRFRGRSQFKPKVIGPKKGSDGTFPVYSDDQIKDIKAGDYVVFIGNLYWYSQQGGGVALGLNFVQFAYPGEALGQGSSMAAISNLGEIEVEVDDASSMVDTEESSEDDAMQFA
jgi:hypothetical protein